MIKNTIQPEEIHSAVRQEYGQIAREFDRTAVGCGCGPSNGFGGIDTQVIYETPDVAELPFAVTGMSLGCGDPVTLASLEPGTTVLDLGSGGGIDCFLAARQVGPSGYVIGVDMTADMVEKARANARKMEAENVEFREAYRVLRSGGKLAVSDIVTRGELAPEVKKDLNSWAGCVAGATIDTEYVAAIKAAGFVDVTIKEKTIDDKGTATQLGLQAEPATQSVLYSARVTARKP